MEKYELFMIVKPEGGEGAQTPLRAEIQGLLDKAGAAVEKVETSTPASLAYPMGASNVGVFQRAIFTASPSAIPALQKSLGFTSGVLRVMITRGEQAPTPPPRLRDMPRTAPHAPKTAAPAPAPSTPKLSQEEIDQRIEEMLKDEIVK